MEIILIIIGIWIVWRLLTAGPRREFEVKGAINRAFVARYQLGQDGYIETPIYWEVIEKFVSDKEFDIVKGGAIAINMKLDSQPVSVTFRKNHFSGTARVSVCKID